MVDHPIYGNATMLEAEKTNLTKSEYVHCLNNSVFKIRRLRFREVE